MSESNFKRSDTKPDGLPVQPEALLGEKERQLAALREIAIALGATLDLDALLRMVMRHVTELMDADRSTLYLVDRQAGELWSKVLQGEKMLEIRLPLGLGLAGWVAEHGEALRIPDAYQDARFNPDYDRQTGYRTRSVLSLPVCNARHELLGVVQVLNKRRGGEFGDSDQHLLQALANQMAVAIENAALLQDTLRRSDELRQARDRLAQQAAELDLLFEVEQSMARAQTMDELLARVLARTLSVVGAEAGSIVLGEDDSDELTFHIALGGRGNALKRVRLQRGQGIAGWVAQHGEAALVTDVDGDPRHLGDLAETLGYRPRSILCVPLPGEPRPIGAIELLDKTGDQPFGEAELRLATLIAGQLAKGLTAARERESREKRTRLAAIGQMLSAVVHDFKTPMTAIGGYVELMSLTEDESERVEQCEIVYKQIERLQEMIHELLMFARGQTEVLLHKVYLDQFATQLRETLTPQFAETGSSFELIESFRGTAYMDDSKMLRVLQNIARNAIEAMAPQGGGQFRLELRGDAEVLEIVCADTGPGIADEVAGRLFESFASHGKVDGTGLGLAIVKKIVEEHHGTIATDSRRGEGTTFTIRVPLQAAGDARGES